MNIKVPARMIELIERMKKLITMPSSEPSVSLKF